MFFYYRIKMISDGDSKTLRILRLINYLYMTSLMLSHSYGYPSGVPDIACDSMFPAGHQSPASHQPPPYEIILPKSSYKPGETLQVTIQSKRRGEYFTGLYVQARLVGCHVNKTETIGAFTCASDLIETRHCFGRVHSAVSHTTGMKKYSMTFYWTAPVVSAGHVAMRATIVKNRATFWTGIESVPLVDLHDNDTPYCVEHSHENGFHFDHNDTKYKYEAKKHNMMSTSHNVSRCGLLSRPKSVYNTIFLIFVSMLVMHL